MLDVLYHRAKFGEARISPPPGRPKTLRLLVHPRSFLRLLPTGDNIKCRTPKYGKNWDFSPPEGDRINRSRRNLARKHIQWVYYSTPNLALIGKRGSVQEPQKCQNLPKLWFLATGSRHNEDIQIKFSG